MMKRTCLTVLAIVTVLSFTGCGASSASSDQSGQSTDATETQTPQVVGETEYDDSDMTSITIDGVSFSIPSSFKKSSYQPDSGNDDVVLYEAATEDGKTLYGSIQITVSHSVTYEGDGLALMASMPFDALSEYYTDVSDPEAFDVDGAEAYYVTAKSTKNDDMVPDAVAVSLSDGYIIVQCSRFGSYPGYPSATDVALTMTSS